MSTKTYFSYIRVSTQRQGQHGTSLVEQQAAIERFAETWKLKIVKRFEERETAAKQGRPVFLDMLKLLRAGHADGVVIHKIDRSARNLKDWADLGSLIDSGIEVHFASESLDLNSRGGRLSADIQAVVASDYIRNLSEEAKKGLYGRLKQGLYPFRAMIGYLDRGSGKPKEIDPETGPLIRRAFELYASGDWSLIELTREMNRSGLRTKTGKKLTKTGLAWILHNSFYMGTILIRKTGQKFAGVHQPIVSRKLFKEVQDVFAGKKAKKKYKHEFVFRKLVNCVRCNRILTPETQKGNVYYRCRTPGCMNNCLRERTLEVEIKRRFKQLEFTEEEYASLRALASVESRSLQEESTSLQRRLQLEQAQLAARASRLADGYLSGVFDEATYIQKKNELLVQELELKGRIADAETLGADFDDLLGRFFELSNSAYLSYISGTAEQQRDLVKMVTANLVANGKRVVIKLKSPFEIVANRPAVQYGWASSDTTRTIRAWIRQVFDKFNERSIASGLGRAGSGPIEADRARRMPVERSRDNPRGPKGRRGRQSLGFS